MNGLSFITSKRTKNAKSEKRALMTVTHVKDVKKL